MTATAEPDVVETPIPAEKSAASHPLSGLGVAACLLVLAIFSFLGPKYFSQPPWLEPIFFAVAALLSMMSFIGAIIEAGKIFRNEGLEYSGASLVFIIPAAAAYYCQRAYGLSEPWDMFLKAAAYLLGAVGCSMLAYSLPLLLPRERVDGTPAISFVARSRSAVDTMATVAVAVASIVSAGAAVVALAR